MVKGMRKSFMTVKHYIHHATVLTGILKLKGHGASFTGVWWVGGGKGRPAAWGKC